MIKIQWLASIWRQNDQNVELRLKTFKTKLNYKSDQNPMWSKSNDLHRFDVKTIKTFKTKLNYKSDQNAMTCIDLTSKRSKCWVTSQNIQNKAKLQKWSKSNDLHRFDVKTIKMLSYVAKHSKQSETTKVIQIQWLASIGCQNDQNKAKLQKCSKSNDLHRLDVKTIKTKLNYKSDQNPILASIWRQNEQNIQNKAKLQKWSKSNDLHRFDVKTIKMLSYVAKHSKQSKTTKVIKIQWLASIWRQNDQNVELRRKTFKTKLNYKSDQNPMTCIDLTSKRSKHSKQS